MGTQLSRLHKSSVSTNGVLALPSEPLSSHISCSPPLLYQHSEVQIRGAIKYQPIFSIGPHSRLYFSPLLFPLSLSLSAHRGHFILKPHYRPLRIGPTHIRQLFYGPINTNVNLIFKNVLGDTFNTVTK